MEASATDQKIIRRIRLSFARLSIPPLAAIMTLSPLKWTRACSKSETMNFSFPSKSVLVKALDAHNLQVETLQREEINQTGRKESEKRLFAYIITDAAHNCLDDVDSSGCADVGLQQPPVYAGCNFHEASQRKGSAPFFRLRVNSRADLWPSEEVPAKIRSLERKGEPESWNRWICEISNHVNEDQIRGFGMRILVVADTTDA